MNRLKELRKEKGISLKELSKEVNISADSLGKYERGERNPKIDKFKKLAKYFNVTVPYLQGIVPREDKRMKLYNFSQSEDPYEMYDEFTVVASSREEAWEAIKNRMKVLEPENYNWINDYSKYDIGEYSLDKPIVLEHFSCG